MRRGHPRPLLQRAAWTPLNGTWDFALDRDASASAPSDVSWDARIRVPFAPETPASGVGFEGFCRAFWYRRRLPPAARPGERALLHFGAVDSEATVWVDGQLAGHHVGGYTPFSIDLTSFARDAVPREVVVRAHDDPHDLAKPRGKQDWRAEPHSIWYPRTSGIWQTVWTEAVPATAIATVRWTPDVPAAEIGLDVRLDGARRDDLRLEVRLTLGGRLLADDRYAVVDGEVRRRIALADPGVDDDRLDLFWSPERPNLIDAELRLVARDGTVVDEVRSYTALRSIAVDGDRILVNGRSCRLRLVLDQGYWPETGLTAPDDAALRRDVELAKAMGFNGVRKHQKIEDPRYLYWADRLGLLVWEELPSAYRFTPEATARLTREWLEVLARDASHPCIMAWVPFNESWGVPALADVAAQRHVVEALHHLTRSVDPTRLVIGNDGWEGVAGDVLGIHDYEQDHRVLARRYHSEPRLAATLQEVRPGGRRIALDGAVRRRPVVLSEMGGVACSDDVDGTWGYDRAASGEALAERYAALAGTIRGCTPIAGFCWTQFADTYQEANGLLRADRTPKVPLERIAAVVDAHPAGVEAEELAGLGGRAA